MPKLFLHLEGVLIFILSLFFYWRLEGSWLLFVLLFLVPDLSMLGYLRNKRFGAGLYNLFHTYTLPILLLIIAVSSQSAGALAVSIIWIAHIAMDRMLGYGLKYHTDFKDTHFQRM